MVNQININSAIHAFKSVNKAINDAISKGYTEIYLTYSGDEIDEEIEVNAPNVSFLFNSMNLKDGILKFSKCNAKAIEFQDKINFKSIFISNPQIVDLNFKIYKSSIDQINISGMENSFISRIHFGESGLNFTSNSLELKSIKIGSITLNSRIEEFSAINCTLENETNILNNVRNIYFEESIINFNLRNSSGITPTANLTLIKCKFSDLQIYSVSCNLIKVYCSDTAQTITLKESHVKNLNVKLSNNSLLDIREAIVDNIELIESRSSSTLSIFDTVVNNIIQLKKSVFAEITISSTKNRPKSINKLNISDCTIKDFFLKDINIEDTANILNTNISSFKSSGVKFSESIHLNSTVFKKVPKFKDTTFFPDINFAGCVFEHIDATDIGNLRYLKHKMAEIENERDEILFASLELDAANKSLKWSSHFLPKLFGYLYKTVNNYGRSISRPLIWILGSIIIGSAVNYYIGITLEFPSKREPVPTYLTDIDSLSEIGKSVLSSIHNSLGPLTFISKFNIFTPNSLLLSCFHFFQNLLTSIFWYLFIVGIRRYFRTL